MEAAPPVFQPGRWKERTLNGMRVLVAEDNVVNQRLAVRMLEQEGCSVAVAQNGLEAVNAALAEQFDAILMDIQMPGMDSFEATAQIRQLPVPWRNLPIIAFSANANSEAIHTAKAGGMDDHVSQTGRSRPSD